MIVNPHPKGWEIISHYTHGLLAGKIAMQLRPELRPDHWEDVLTAIIEHDDHLMDFDEKNYLTDAGGPLDFTLDHKSDDDALERAKRIYRNALQKSQLVALLIGRHLEFLYEEKSTNHSSYKKFFKDVKDDRKEQVNLYGWKKTTLEKTYQLMRFCDRCSLILCQDLIPSPGRKLEINQSIKEETYFILNTDKGTHITPWPFAAEGFQLAFEVRVVKKLHFESNQELKDAIRCTRPELKVLHLTKNSSDNH